MAHLRNEEFYLYTGLAPNTQDNYDALMHLKQLGESFKYTHLFYGDPDQHPELFKALKTWGPNLDDLAFPFVVYTKVEKVGEFTNQIRVFVKGIKEIKETDWVALSNFKAE